MRSFRWTHNANKQKHLSTRNITSVFPYDKHTTYSHDNIPSLSEFNAQSKCIRIHKIPSRRICNWRHKLSAFMWKKIVVWITNVGWLLGYGFTNISIYPKETWFTFVRFGQDFHTHVYLFIKGFHTTQLIVMPHRIAHIHSSAMIKIYSIYEHTFLSIPKISSLFMLWLDI